MLSILLSLFLIIFSISIFQINLGTVLEVQSDAAERWQLGFQDPATPIMEGIEHFHNDLMFFIITIAVFVTWILYRSIVLFKKDNLPDVHALEGREAAMSSYSNGVYHHTLLEVIWTSIPALILGVIAVPSFALLYSIEEFVEPSLSVKVTGHQWYWCYEFSNCKEPNLAQLIEGKKYESYMVASSDLVEGELRLLEVDQRLLLPIKTHIQVYVTAADVLHCWTVPSLGVKLDACPGRLNQVSTYIKRAGVFYGQCSEICGINHGFMPIVVEAVSMKEFVYNKYIEALLNIVDEDPDLELIQDASATQLSSLEIMNKSTNVSTSFDLSKLEDKNYLIELSSQNSRKI